MGLRCYILTDKSRDTGPKRQRGVAGQDRAGLWRSFQNERKRAAHGRHTVERDALAGLLGRLLFFHHPHAVGHGRCGGHRRDRPSRTGGIGRRLAQEANKGCDEQKMAKQAHHRFS